MFQDTCDTYDSIILFSNVKSFRFFLSWVATVLEISEIRENEKQMKNSQGKVREIDKKGEVREKSRNFGRLSERKGFATLQVQLDDLSFC